MTYLKAYAKYGQNWGNYFITFECISAMMKNISFLFIMAIIFAIGACKKDINCGSHGRSNDGNCVCDVGWSGSNCDISSPCDTINCGLHGHCVYGVCRCDSGWSGINCTLQGVIDYSCLNVNCGAHGHCVDGLCVCDSLWSGVNCQIASPCLSVNCGANGHCVNGNCICDSGWTGANCDVQCQYALIDSFVGNYHMTGTYYYGSPFGTGTNPRDEIITITKIGPTTLSAYGRNLELQTTGCTIWGDYVYSVMVCNCMPVTLTFQRSNIDLITYRDWQTSPGHTTDLNLTGVKIH